MGSRVVDWYRSQWLIGVGTWRTAESAAGIENTFFFPQLVSDLRDRTRTGLLNRNEGEFGAG